MMNHEELQKLRADIARKKQLTVVQKELHDQLQELQQNLYSLRAACRAEEMDVELLEGRSLTALLYALIGRKAEKLDAERREACAAKLKCEIAEDEIVKVKSQLYTVEAELAPLNGCEDRYERLMQQRSKELRTSGTHDGEELVGFEEQLAIAEHRHREILEALTAGRRALAVAWTIDSALEQAKKLGVWDMHGGGALVTWEKHEQLDSAQKQVGFLQEQLREFKTELADIRLQADLQVNIRGFARFADYFFDSFFTDLAIQDCIDFSLSQVGEVRHAIERILRQLEQMQTEIERETGALRARISAILEKAE